MSAVLAALRHTELTANEDRAFMLHITMRYGRKVNGTVSADRETAHADGGVGIHIWKNNEATDEVTFVTLAEVLWCEIEWFDQ